MLKHRIMQQEILSQYKKQLWRATNQIIGADPVDFTTFDAPGLYNEATNSAITNPVDR